MVPIAAWSHEVVLAAQPISVGLAREFVRMHLDAHGLPFLVEDVRMVVSELSTNAVTHAATPFSVTLSRENGWVLVSVQDGSTLAPLRPTSDDLGVSGRGLVIVERISHTWGISSDGHGLKSVWASFPGSRL